MPLQTKSKNIQNTAQLLEQKILFHPNINNKNMCKIICKMQCLKNGLKFNVSEGSVSSINHIHTDLF